MTLVKVGKDDGKVIEVHSNFAKLGAKYTCKGCGKPCVAATSNEIATKTCPECRG